MIFLKGLNILFLKPEKVAGTSFEIALSRYAGPADIITRINRKDEETRSRLGHRGPQNYRKTRADFAAADVLHLLRAGSAPQIYAQHMTAREARGAMGPEVFDGALKLSIVRNPFDRLVSHYHWRNKGRTDLPAFPDWLRANPEIINFNDRFYRIDGQDIIDHYLRFEDLDGDIGDLEARFPDLAGLADTLKGITSKGDVRPKERTLAAYYGGDEDLVAAVRFLNRDHVDRFGYGLEPG